MVRKMISANWKEFNPAAKKSIKEDFKNIASPNKSKIIEYLNAGTVVLAATSTDNDILTGEKIAPTRCILTDGEFSWPNSLGYYVEKYNLEIPRELEDKIVNSYTVAKEIEGNKD